MAGGWLHVSFFPLLLCAGPLGNRTRRQLWTSTTMLSFTLLATTSCRSIPYRYQGFNLCSYSYVVSSLGGQGATVAGARALLRSASYSYFVRVGTDTTTYMYSLGTPTTRCTHTDALLQHEYRQATSRTRIFWCGSRLPFPSNYSHLPLLSLFLLPLSSPIQAFSFSITTQQSRLRLLARAE